MNSNMTNNSNYFEIPAPNKGSFWSDGDYQDALKQHQEIIARKIDELREKVSKKNVTGEQLLNDPATEIPSLLDPFLKKTGLACLAGSSDTGKSSLLRQLALSVALCRNNFLGFPLYAKQNRVLYVATEDGKQATSVLLQKQTKGIKPEELINLHFIFDSKNLLKEIEERLIVENYDLIIIDSFADAFGEDLKDSQKIRAFLQPFHNLSEQHECLFLFLHHIGKRTENVAPNKNNLLSGQGFEAKMRIVIELRTDNIDPRKKHICIVKGNYLPSDAKNESYVLEFDETTLTFTNTGERVPFESLAKKSDDENLKLKFEKALELKAQGLTYEQIAPKIGYGSKSAISKLLEAGRKNGWAPTAN